MTTATLPSGTGIVSTNSYDDADRLTGITHVKGGSTTVASVAYTLDQVGNRTQRVDQQGTHTYAYGDLYRLTSVTYPGPATTSYAFDAFGNRTSMTVGGNATTYAYDDNDRITSVTPPSPASVINLTWDDNGDLTARGSDSFAWDYEDRMTSATVNSVTTTFAYRGDGLRDSRTVGGNTATFTWDISGGLPVVLDDGNQYVYGSDLTAQKQSGSWYYYLADGLGSTMAVVNASGVVQNSYTYDVYGKPAKTGSLANEFDFAGQQTDGTGLQYLRARYYDPVSGTFASREPMGANPGWLGSHFAYGRGNPAVMSDPSGLIPDDNSNVGGTAGSSDCASYCWQYVDPGNFGYQLPTGLWLERLMFENHNTGYYHLCELVGEYAECSGVASAAAVQSALDGAYLEDRIVDLLTNLAVLGLDLGPVYKTEPEARKAAAENGWQELGTRAGLRGRQWFFKDQQGRTLARDNTGHMLSGGTKKAWKIYNDRGEVIGALDEALNFIPLK